MMDYLKDNLKSIGRLAVAALPIVKLVTALVVLFEIILGLPIL